MNSVVSLYSNCPDEIKKFLRKFFNNENLNIENDLEWSKSFSNSVEIADMIGVFIDNIDKYKIAMWVSIDEGISINVTENNADDIIKYLYERYPW